MNRLRAFALIVVGRLYCRRFGHRPVTIARLHIQICARCGQPQEQP